MNVGRQVKILRKRLGLTQDQFAAAMIPRSDFTYIGKIERDDQYPSIKMLERMSKAFNKPLSYWFEKDSEIEVISDRIHKGALGMRALACLFSKYCWDEGRFSVCPVSCELQDGLCKTVKALITTKEIEIKRE